MANQDFLFSFKVLLHCAIFSAICLAMAENVALQVPDVWCWGPVTLCNFLSNMSRNAPRKEEHEVCACTLVKTAVELRDKLLVGWYTVQWHCQLLQSVAKSRAEFYFVQRFAQQNNCETTHVTLCNSPATCLATALRDKLRLLRKLHNVTGPLGLSSKQIVHFSNHHLKSSGRFVHHINLILGTL